MPPFRVVPIVEGHGEVTAVPVLLRRMIPIIDDQRWPDVARPLRVNRSSLLKQGQLERYVELAARQLGEGPAGVLVLVDADEDCAGQLGPELLSRGQQARPGLPLRVVLAVCEFEAWFLASAASLRGERGLPADLEPPPHPEAVRDAKGWLQDRRTDDLAYSPTVDQPALAASFDLAVARRAAPSFAKFWRDVANLMGATP